MQDHRKETLETRMALVLGRPPDNSFVNGLPDGALPNPHILTQAWTRALIKLGLPRVTLHALRHMHSRA